MTKQINSNFNFILDNAKRLSIKVQKKALKGE